MIRRLLVGLLKGAIVGGAVGALLHFALGWTYVGGVLAYLLYGGVGLVAGVAAGQPPWRDGAWVASILKGLVGFGIAAGLYALTLKFLAIPVGGLAGIPSGTELANAPLLFAPLLAAIYSTFVELDDGGESQNRPAKTGIRVTAESSGAAEEVEEGRGGGSARNREGR